MGQDNTGQIRQGYITAYGILLEATIKMHILKNGLDDDSQKIMQDVNLITNEGELSRTMQVSVSGNTWVGSARFDTYERIQTLKDVSITKAFLCI